MNQLANLLEARAESLVRRWTEEVRNGLAPDETSEPELRDHVPDLLRELMAALRRGMAPDASVMAREHGRQRQRVGFDLEALVREYGLLRELIMDLIEEAKYPVVLAEIRVLSDFIATAIAEGVAEHARQREHERNMLSERHVQALREREVWLWTTLSSIGDAVIATDAQGRVAFLNPTAEALTGWRGADAKGRLLKELLKLIQQHTRAPVVDPLERVLREGVLTDVGSETLLVGNDGSETPIDYSAAPIRAHDGALQGIVLVLRDITEKSRLDAEREALFQQATAARAAAEAERQKLDSLLMQAPVAVAIHEGPRHTYTFANPSYRAIVGNRDIVGKPLLDALPELKGQGFDALFDRVMSTGETYVNHQAPARVDRTGDGTLEDGFYKVVFTAKRNAYGEADGVLQCAIDVTDEVRANQQLEVLTQQVRTSEAELRLVMDSIPLLVSFVTKEERYRTVNRAYEDWFGLSQAAVVGKTLTEVIGGAAYAVLGPYVRRALAGERITFEQHAVPYRHGGTRDVRVTMVPHRDDANAVDGYVALLEDVTLRRRLELERETLLAQAEGERQKLHSVFMQAPVAICMLEGSQHTYTFANPRYLVLMNGRQVVGKTLREAFPDVRENGFDKLMDRVLATGEPYVGKEAVIKLHHHREDESLIVDFIYQPKRNARGEVDGILAVITDVTEQVQARQRAEALAGQLRESEERLLKVMEASGTAIWEVNPTAHAASADARFQELFGLTPDELVSAEKGLAIIHPEDSPQVAQAVTDALAGKDGGQYRVDYRVRRRGEDTYRWVEARGRAHFASDGQPVRFWGTALDITARKEAEAAQARLLSALADQPLLYVALLRGPQLRFEMANAGYRAIVGGRDVVGKTLLEALPELAGQGIDALLQGVLTTGKAFVGSELHLLLDRRGEGVTDAFFNFVYQAVPGPKGENESVLVIGHDVTEAVLARRQAQQQERERSDFEQQLIGIVSHDLRTPVNAIALGVAALLQRGGLDGKDIKFLLRIQSSAERMSRMVRDLLDFTQARLGGGIQVMPKSMDLHAFAHAVVEEVRANFPERELRLEADGDGQGAWDADRLAQVLTNLVSNALKYSPDPSPVTVRTHGESEWVLIEVHNEGAPIPAEALAHLFQPMWRATAQLDKAGRSVGLGLYIVKHLVDAHGGDVTVRSSAEAGTLFTVRLPRVSGERSSGGLV